MGLGEHVVAFYFLSAHVVAQMMGTCFSDKHYMYFLSCKVGKKAGMGQGVYSTQEDLSSTCLSHSNTTPPSQAKFASFARYLHPPELTSRTGKIVQVEWL